MAMRNHLFAFVFKSFGPDSDEIARREVLIEEIEYFHYSAMICILSIRILRVEMSGKHMRLRGLLLSHPLAHQDVHEYHPSAS